jgi:hypothetical protein
MTTRERRCLVLVLSGGLPLLVLACQRQTASPSATMNSHTSASQKVTIERAASPEKKQVVPHEYLELTVNNATGHEVDNVSLLLEGNSCTFGIVGSGASAGYLGWFRPIGTNVIVRWREAGGQKREAEVDISKIYDRKSAGDLTFVVKNGTATASFKRIERGR